MSPTCSVDGCVKAGRLKRGLCEMHYQRLRLSGDVGPSTSKHVSNGSTGNCRVPDCDRGAHARGLCQMHYKRKSATGDVGTAASRSPTYTHRNPQSTRMVNSQGYVEIKVPGHVQAKATGWALEHRVVMSDRLGRRLLREENVHHINGDRLDNRLENLELWSSSQPWGQRVVDKVAWAREIIALYGETYSLPANIAQPS